MTLLGRVVVLVLVTAAPAALAQQAAVAPRTAPMQLEGSAAPTPWQRYGDWTKTRWDNYNSLAKPDATPSKGSEIVLSEVAGHAAKAGRGPRRARPLRQSRRRAHRGRGGPVQAARAQRQGVCDVSRHAADQLQALGGRDAEVGAAAQEGAGRRGIPRPSRQG